LSGTDGGEKKGAVIMIEMAGKCKLSKMDILVNKTNKFYKLLTP